MPRYIVRLSDAGRDWYLEWSTVVDAPITYGASLDEFREHYRSEYGEDGMRHLDERLRRVAANGTSSQMGESAEQLISGNRAGDDESELSMAAIIQKYCLSRPAD